MPTPNELTYFPVTGYFNTGVGGSLETFDTTVVFTPRVPPGFTALISDLDLGNSTSGSSALAFPPIVIPTNKGVLTTELLSNSAPVAAALVAAGITQLIYDVQFTKISLGYQIENFSIIAPTDGTPVCITDPALARYEYGGTVPVVSLPPGITAFGASLVSAATLTAAQAMLGIDIAAADYRGAPPSQSAMTALTAKVGDYCYRTDVSDVFYLTATPASSAANWKTASQIHVWPFPMARNTIAAIGDSVTSRGGFALYQPAIGYSYLQQLQVLTHQRIRFGGGNFAVSGTGTVQAQSTQLPQVLALNPLPGACVLGVGPTDMRQSVSSFATSFPVLISAVKSMVTSLLSVGVVPVMFCVPPDQNTSVLPAAQYQANIRKWNSWVTRYAALNGFPVIDAFTPLAAADGTFLSGTDAGDATHPGPTGMRLIAQQALADGLADIFPPGSLVHTARTTDDLSNLINNGTVNYGLFTTDSNADGVADGYATTGSGTTTYSLVAPAASDQLRGKWQQIGDAAGNHGSIYFTISPSFYSVGDVLAIAARVQASGVEASGAGWQCCAVLSTPGGYVTPDGINNTFLYGGAISYASDVQDGEVYSEFTITPEMTSVTVEAGFNISPTSGSATLRVGEFTLRNLTKGGLLA